MKLTVKRQIASSKPKAVKVKLDVLNPQRIMEKAKETLRKLDQQMATKRAERGKYESERVREYIDLSDPASCIKATDNSCWRPDLYFKGGKACDSCSLFPLCNAGIKRLKIPGSQPADRVAGILKKEREAYAAMSQRPKISLRVGKKPMIQVRLKK